MRIVTIITQNALGAWDTADGANVSCGGYQTLRCENTRSIDDFVGLIKREYNMDDDEPFAQSDSVVIINCGAAPQHLFHLVEHFRGAGCLDCVRAELLLPLIAVQKGIKKGQTLFFSVCDRSQAACPMNAWYSACADENMTVTAHLLNEPNEYAQKLTCEDFFAVSPLDAARLGGDPELEAENAALKERILALEKEREASSARKKAQEQNLAVGSTVKFGHYEQDDAVFHYKDPIEWLVIREHRGRFLLLSKYGIDTKPYNTQNLDIKTDSPYGQRDLKPKNDEITWEFCSLRTWLNEDFLNSSFTKEERKLIIQVKNINKNNAEFSTHGGNITLDNVFLLSSEEMDKYVQNDFRFCSPTPYAESQGAFIKNNNCWWWLRSPGVTGTYAALVNEDGEIYSRGTLADIAGGSVRPALWVAHL